MCNNPVIAAYSLPGSTFTGLSFGILSLSFPLSAFVACISSRLRADLLLWDANARTRDGERAYIVRPRVRGGRIRGESELVRRRVRKLDREEIEGGVVYLARTVGSTFDVQACAKSISRGVLPGVAGARDGTRANDAEQRTETKLAFFSVANTTRRGRRGLSSSSLAQRVGKLFPTLLVARCPCNSDLARYNHSKRESETRLSRKRNRNRERERERGVERLVYFLLSCNFYDPRKAAIFTGSARVGFRFFALSSVLFLHFLVLSPSPFLSGNIFRSLFFF